MNIKRAKKEIQDSVTAYLKKDSYGEYMIPSIRQRPILLMGPPGIGKTQIMEQVARHCGIALVSYTITQGKVQWSLYQRENLRRENIFRHGIYHERDHFLRL